MLVQWCHDPPAGAPEKAEQTAARLGGQLPALEEETLEDELQEVLEEALQHTRQF